MGDVMTKKELRKATINQLKSLTDKYTKENMIIERLIKHQHFKDAESIGITLSMDHEMDTRFIIRYAQMLGKTVFVPKCDYSKQQMYFTYFTSVEDIVEDRFGIDVMKHDDGKNEQPALLIVPGVRFDESGYRIGYGGGYYDKYLSTYEGHTISLVFEAQMGEVIIEPHDIPVAYIITEEREWHTGTKQ